ncbi:hypothetical protein ONZ51_g158 [Trametes cubensis]|uniref:Uncharacterized protein n=1 Tax=Trametes cubensis TaxID=1111947 RepID=A0AAD7U3Y5_9APHY|nr:hypothetical protein ONZ51_g158 [Trametes cubensis]
MSTTDAFPIARAEIVALFVESILFGAFTVLFAIAIWILRHRGKVHGRLTTNRVLCATSTAMWLLSVAHLVLDMTRAIRGFTVEGQTASNTEAFYARISDPTNVATNTIYLVTTLLADSFFSYRLYIVWNRTWWIVIVPALLVLSTAVTGIGVCVEIGLTKPGNPIFASNLQPWIRTFFALSLTTNLFATVLIIGRIMWANRRVREYRANGAMVGSHWNVVEIVIQSAAVYSAALIAMLGTYLANSNAQYVCLDIIQPLIGIVFTLIIIRVGLASTMESTVRGSSGDGLPYNYDRSTHRSGVPAPGQLQTIGGHAYPLRPVAINVSVDCVRDGDGDGEADEVSFTAFGPDGKARQIRVVHDTEFRV